MADAGAAMQVEAAGQAVLAALDWQSSTEARQQATAYLESLKAGEVHILATVAFALVRSDRTSEVRLVGLKLLQHMIRMRWEDLNVDERRQMASMACDLLQESARPNEPWVLKSQVAALMAEVARREGLPMWGDLLPALFNLGETSPLHAELVAMFFRWLPEDVTVHNEDLEGDRRRELLQGLSQTLPKTLPFLYKLLDQHFGAAMTAVKQNQLESATQHAAAVTATLNAVVAYAEWAPVSLMASFGLIQACGFLLNASEFRASACEVFKLLAARRRPLDETAAQYDVAMETVFETLCNASKAYFTELHQRASSNLGEEDEGSVEFGECLCEAMVALGSQNLHCVARDESKVTVYLHQMLCFLQHPKLALHSLALPLWTTLLRESTLAMSTTDLQGLTEKEKEKRSHAVIIPQDFCTVLLDIAFQRLLIKDGGDGLAENETWAQEFSSASDFSQFRSRLVELVRHIATQQPILAATKVAERLQMAFSSPTSETVSSKEVTTLETTQMYLENIMNGIPDRLLAAALIATASPNELGTILEGILQRLLIVDWKGPVLVELHTRHFDAIGPYFKHSPAAIPVVVEKLFKLLTSLPVSRDYGDNVKDSMRARLQVCTSFLRLARAGDIAMLPHMEGIAATMTTFHDQGLMVRSELNLLGEALLIVGSAAGVDQQSQVLEWLFGPLREQWIQPAWQEKNLSSPGSLVQLLSQDLSNPQSHEEIWSMYHTITFFERALRRCTNPGKASSAPEQNVDMDAAAAHSGVNATVLHLTWMVPPLLKLLRCMHALWSPSVLMSLPPRVKGALEMGEAEQAALLGELATIRGASAMGDSRSDFGSSIEENGVKEIRTWLKGVRDSGYNILGLAAVRTGDRFFDNSDGRAGALATALLENIEHMELHHIRQVLHLVVIPVVKVCPVVLWDMWLGQLLPPVLIHCHRVLTPAWRSLLQEGSVKGPSIWGGESAAGLGNSSSPQQIKSEVMKDKLLRDLTRETCHLLSSAATPALNRSSQIDQNQGDGGGMDVMGQQFNIAGSLIGFIMQHGEAAQAALHVGIDALEWPDSDAVHKAIIFCAAVVNVAALAGDSQLQEVVGKDMFSAAIRGLTLESNASAQAELVGLLRDIYLRLGTRSATPRQVLLALPSITPDTLSAFEAALQKTSSAKEQRQHIKSFLLSAGGDQLKALKPQKNTNVITNVTNRSVPGQFPERGLHSEHKELGTIGLAAII